MGSGTQTYSMVPTVGVPWCLCLRLWPGPERKKHLTLVGASLSHRCGLNCAWHLFSRSLLHLLCRTNVLYSFCDLTIGARFPLALWRGRADQAVPRNISQERYQVKAGGATRSSPFILTLDPQLGIGGRKGLHQDPWTQEEKGVV